MRRPCGLRVAAAITLAAALPACSVKSVAVNSLGNALAEGGSSYAKDDDPDLVWEAVPFGLKTIEGLLDQAPRHKGLLYAAASGFVQYGYGHVQQEADFVEATDLARATALRGRARRLYRRALDYGLRGLEVDFPGFRDALRKDTKATLARTRREHVPLMFWTALAWGAAMSLSKEDAELTADQAVAEALMARCLALDEGYEYGSGHDFFISYEGRGAQAGGSVDRSRVHLERSMALSKGWRAFPLVTFAESVSVAAQDRKEFRALLDKALALDPDAHPEVRLSNLIAQKRARWLLGRADELFVD
jgi:predicted anti-sigma-YlaC factor YlaD